MQTTQQPITKQQRIQQLATELVKRYETWEKQYTYTIHLPLEKINNVKVTTCLDIQARDSEILIYVTRDKSPEFDCVYRLQEKDVKPTGDLLSRINQMLTAFHDVLPTLKTDKYVGCFYDSVYNTLRREQLDYDNLCKIFEDIPNVEHAGKCCVCYEFTKTHTKCDHSLCIECWSDIRTNPDGECEGECDGDCKCIHCPVCRQVIY